MLKTFCPRNVIGVPRVIPCNLANAIRLPVVVKEPSITSKLMAAILTPPSSEPWRMYSAMPTSAAANAPKAWESAVRCGIAVIGTQ
jgi:hypothetical protein